MKRFLISLLIVSMTLFMNLNAMSYAYTDTSINEEKESALYVEIDELGRYVKTKTNNNLIAQPSNDYGIFILKDGTMLSDTGTQFMQEMERREINLHDVSKVNDVLSDTSISSGLADSISEKSQQAVAIGNTEATAVIYTPKESTTEALTTSYYTYNGYNMKDELLYYYSIMTPYEIIKEGITSNDTAANMFETAFIVTAASNVYVGLFSTAISALTAYINYTGQTPITGSYSDFVQVKLKYNTYTKYTYVDIGGYMIGAVTRQIKLVSSDVFQYYFNYYGGSEVNTHKDYYSCYIKTPNYNNPAPIALQYVNVPWVETINAHICNHPIYF